jgi:hypothetical protein
MSTVTVLREFIRTSDNSDDQDILDAAAVDVDPEPLKVPLPFFNYWFENESNATKGMSYAARCAYNDLRDYYLRNGGLPKDPASIRRIAGMENYRKWPSVLEELRKRFTPEWRSERLEKIMQGAYKAIACNKEKAARMRAAKAAKKSSSE